MTSNQHYLDAYPVLTQEWEDVFEGIGCIRFQLKLNTAHPSLDTRLFILNKLYGDTVHLEVKHYIHGLCTEYLGKAVDPADVILNKAEEVMTGAMQSALDQYKAFQAELRKTYEL